MKVCLIYDFLTEFGGLEREIVNHSQMLQKDGHNVEVLTCHIDPETVKKMEFRDIKITNISKLKTKYELISLISCFLGLNKLKNHNPDIFLSYSFPSNYLIRKKKAKRINYVNHYPHFLYLSKKDRKEWASGTKGAKRWVITAATWFLSGHLKKLDKNLVNKNDIIFMNSDFTKKRLDKIYNTHDSVVSYVPVDPVFKPSPKKIKEKFIFSSSRIIPDKKYEWLIKACSLMNNKLPLRISGQGNPDYQEKLRKLAKEKKVDLKFVGRLTTDDLLAHYTNAQVFAFPTPGEDFGLVPAESLACGTPVVVWGDGAGPTEQIIDGVNGFHARPFDLKDFAAKIDKVIDTKLKIKNRKKILKSSEKFTAKEIKKDFMKHVNKILTK